MAGAKNGVTTIRCVLALLLFASVAVPQSTQAPAARTGVTEAPGAMPQAIAQTASAVSTAEKAPPGSLKISYVGGQLRIDARDTTLRDVLTKLGALIGVKIEIPAGASEPLPVIKLGPGTAREILASLLYGSKFDYLILSSDTDPQGIQSVELMPRSKNGNGGFGAELAARPSRSPAASAWESSSGSDETPEPSSSVPAQPDNTAAEAKPVASAPTQPEDSAQPDQPVTSLAGLSNVSGLTTAGALSPPSSMDPQNINQQLQQMYQQRLQMMQQQRQSASPATPPSQ